MLAYFIRDHLRHPVACVVSTGPGRVGWSVYNPEDAKLGVRFTKVDAKRYAGERESCTLRDAQRDAVIALPVHRTVSKYVVKQVRIIDHDGIEQCEPLYRNQIEYRSLATEICEALARMYERSKKYTFPSVG